MKESCQNVFIFSCFVAFCLEVCVSLWHEKLDKITDNSRESPH